MKVRVELAEDVPQRYRRVLASSSHLAVVESNRTAVTVDGNVRPLQPLPRPVSADVEVAIADLAAHVPDGQVGMVIASSIPSRERGLLERAGLSWCDERDALHVSWPGVLVHVECDKRERTPTTERPAGLGAVGIRAVQVLLAEPEEDWTTTRLSAEAQISIGQAHKVLSLLEEHRLVETRGRGRQQRRRITDYRQALDWLAERDGARRKPQATPAFLYGRTPEELLARLCDRARSENVDLAVTGAAASHAMGFPLLTALTVVHVRVQAPTTHWALDRLGLDALDPDDTGRGANLELWIDIGELGTYRSRDINGVQVAPNVRVWLDMLREGGRNQDAAEHFREAVLERS